MKKILAAILLAMSLVCGSVGLSNAFEVKNDIGHPRIMYTPEDVAYLKTKWSDTSFPYTESLVDRKNWCDDRIARNYKTSYYGKYYLLMHLLTEGTPYWRKEYRDWSIEIAMGLVNSNKELTGEGTGFSRLSFPVLVYDWAYKDLTDTQRKTIQDKVLPKNITNLLNYDNLWILNEAENKFPIYIGAFYGDRASYANGTITNTNLKGQLDRYKNRLDNQLIPCLDEISPNGSIDGYGGLRAMTEIVNADFYRKYTDYDPFEESSHFANMKNFWAARYVTNLDEFIRMPAKYNTSDMGTYYFAYFGNRLNDAPSKYLFKQCVQRDHFELEYSAAFYPNIDEYVAPAYFDNNFYDPGMGFYLGKTKTDDHTYYTGFFNGPDTQGHRSQNHFYFMIDGYPLFYDAGKYTGDLSSNYWWYRHAIAHNTLLVKNPSQNIVDYLKDCRGADYVIPYFGDQSESNEVKGNQEYPLCGGVRGYRGEITEYTVTNIGNKELVKIQGDATEVYSDRLSSWKRTIVFVKSNPPVILMQDYIVPKSNMDVSVLFHTIDKPIVNSFTTSQVVKGNANGGVITYKDVNQLTIANGDYSGTFNILNGANVKLIGGPNANGQNWKQDFDPTLNCTSCGANHDSYDSNTSYEFYVEENGDNLVPYRCGTTEHGLPTLEDVRTRNEGMDVACDWRFELESVTSNPFYYNYVFCVDNSKFEKVSNNECKIDNLNVVFTVNNISVKEIVIDAPPVPVGACCLVTEQCVVASMNDCSDQGGTYQGDNSNCSRVNCKIPEAPVDTVFVPVPCDTVYFELSVPVDQKILKIVVP